MNKAAADFFDQLPSEVETEPEFKFMEAEPEKDKTQVETPPEKVEPEAEKEEIERKKPLRSERRAEKQTEFLQKQWQEEREARIRLEEQVKALASQKVVETDPDIRKLLTEVKDPEEGTKIFGNLLNKIKQEAAQQAREEYLKAQSEGDEEVNELKSTIERSIESIEDRYGVDLTDDTNIRNAFLDFVESIAPEDSDALPNMNMAWKLFQANQRAPATESPRKNQVSSRSMTRSVQARPEGKNIKPVTFDEINKGNWWDKIISGR